MLGGKTTKTLIEKVWDRIDKGEPDECWLWTGHRLKKGYENIMVYLSTVDGKKKYKSFLATRLIMDAPENLMVRHTCDNPPCCNPAHLVLGTGADNARDMYERGRAPVPNVRMRQ